MNHIKWLFVLVLGCISFADAFAVNVSSMKIRDYGLNESYTTTAAAITFCAGQSIHVEADVTGAGPFTYQWYKDGNPLTGSNSSALDITSAAISNTGEYFCLVTDNNHCSITTSAVNIQVQPYATVTVTGDTNLYLGETTELTAHGATTYHWTNMTSYSATLNPVNPNYSIVDITPTDVNTYVYKVEGSAAGYCTNDTMIRIRVYGCGPGYDITDDNHYTYHTKAYNHQCWTLENLRSTMYSDGSTIPTALLYDVHYSNDPDGSIFGRLYDWSSATKLTPATYTALPAGSAIQGACPAGWELPKEADYIGLLGAPHVNDVYDLHSVAYWLNNLGTNASEFNMPGAGFYNAVTNRFENIFGYAYFITADSYLNSQTSSIVNSSYYCSELNTTTSNINNAYSIRCLKRIP